MKQYLLIIDSEVFGGKAPFDCDTEITADNHLFEIWWTYKQGTITIDSFLIYSGEESSNRLPSMIKLPKAVHHLAVQFVQSYIDNNHYFSTDMVEADIIRNGWQPTILDEEKAIVLR